MHRQAYTMRLKPGFAAEYKRRHDEIWPELARELRAAGISDFSIFLDEDTHTLFAVRRVADTRALAELPRLPVVKRWWQFMAPLMEVHPDDAPKEWPLKEVFHLD